MYKLSEIVALCGGSLIGDDVAINRVCTINNSQVGAITFLKSGGYKKYLADCKASAIIVTEDDLFIIPDNNLFSKIVVSDVDLYMTHVIPLFMQENKLVPGIANTAVIDLTATVASTSKIDNYVMIGANSCIGDNCWIHAHVVIEQDVSIGNNCIIHPNVVIHAGTIIGSDCEVASGSVLGSSGFGYAEDEQHMWHKLPQIGKLFIGNRVSIGANVNIARGAIDSTIIEDDVIIDSLVQVAHNVKIGQGTAIAGNAGIAGSTTIGKYCKLGGACMITGHIEIADHTVISGGTAITKTIDKPGYYCALYPSEEWSSWAKNASRIKQLSDMYRRLSQLEKDVISFRDLK